MLPPIFREQTYVRSRVSAHVIIPTHSAHDTLRFAVLSALDQTLSPEKVTIIGDGATANVRAVAETLSDEFPSVEFVDKPKLANRGERYRDEVIRASDSDLISYLCDDDLYLPNHLEVMAEHLAEFDFVHPRPTFVNPDDTFFFIPSGIESPKIRDWHRLNPPQNSISLTGASHTRRSYLSLEEGWNPGPPEFWTDLFMWVKFFANHDVKTFTSPHTTTIKLMYTQNQRDNRDRTELIERWFRDTRDSSWLASFRRRLDTLAKEIVFHNTSELQILGSALAERDALQSERDALQTEREALRAECDATVAELNSVVNSNSWRLTKPLRDIRRFFGGG